MKKRENDHQIKKYPKYIHINPKKGNIVVDNYSPVVIMKKIKLGPSDGSGFASVVKDFLPELTDAEEKQDIESQGLRREGSDKARPVPNEDVSFIHTVTKEELNDHIQKCLEMSSENKINQKNAFALQLIDCFSFLQKKKDFSAMAFTLDAGTKIYSCRVDALHQQVMKLADEVIVRNKSTEKEDDKDDETVTGKRSTREQRKARKNKFIASSETLNRKMKAKDPKDKYIRLEALPGAILSGARRDPNDLSLSLERYAQFWPNWTDYKPLRAKGTVSLPHIKIFREKAESRILESFPSTEPDQRQTNLEHFFHGDDDNDCVAFEENSLSETVVSIVHIPASELLNGNDGGKNSITDDTEHDLCENCKFGKDEVGVASTEIDVVSTEVGVVSTAMDRLREEAEANGAVNRAPTRTEALKILFNISSEYDYLNMKSCNYWAGPEFWKRPQWKNGSDKSKMKVPNRKREPADIMYDFQDLDKRLLILSNKMASLSERTTKNWRTKKTTLPTNLKIDLSQFFSLFHIDNCGETSEKSVNSQNVTSFVDVLQTFEETEVFTDTSTDPFNADQEDNSSSQDPMNATFYEAPSVQSQTSEPRNPLESTFYDAGPSKKESGKIIRVEVSTSVNSDFGESSMVPVPKMVNINPIKFSTRPIRVDMQHLKHAMLEVIKEEFERDSRGETIQSGAEDGLPASKPGVKFRDILRVLPKRLERRTREDLSVALAVTAVLSLANENRLQLENCEDGDFVVRFPDFSTLVSEDHSGTERQFRQ